MSDVFPVCLTIAGSDSGGGAGIQADLRTFHAFRVYGCSVITAVTAQNPHAVTGVEVMKPEIVECQLKSIMQDFPVRYAKTGMLASEKIVTAVAKFVEKQKLPLVVDPVMVSTSGTRLLAENAVEVMKEKLFPLASWLTPNIPEAELILGAELKCVDDFKNAARILGKLYRCGVILKSGHALGKHAVTDVVYYGGELFELSSPRVDVPGNTAHGTGCTLSAALAANLASGKCWQDACREAKAFVYGSLVENIRLNASLFQMYPPVEKYLNDSVLKHC